MLYFAHATLGFSYAEIDGIPTEYLIRMLNVHKQFYEQKADTTQGENIVIPDLPSPKELMRG